MTSFPDCERTTKGPEYFGDSFDGKSLLVEYKCNTESLDCTVCGTAETENVTYMVSISIKREGTPATGG